MANDHKTTLLTDKTFRKLFTPEERQNLRPVHFAGGNPRRKCFFEVIPGRLDRIRVYTETHGVIICEKIDPAKGPAFF
jgi:hypothetical protein